MHKGVRMSEIEEILEKSSDFSDVRFTQSKVGSYAIVTAKVKLKGRASCLDLRKIMNLCNTYLCRAKIILTHKDATITFYDEPVED